MTLAFGACQSVSNQRGQRTLRRGGYRPGPLAAIPELDCPIIAPAEAEKSYGTVEVFGSPEWDHACQQEEDRWTSLLRGEQ